MGWGSSTRRGGGRKVRARPRKFVFLGFPREESGMSRKFCRDVPDPRGCSKSLCKKRLVCMLHSLTASAQEEQHQESIDAQNMEDPTTSRNLLRTNNKRSIQPRPPLSSGKEKHININKYAGLSRDWVGAEKLFMCFFGVIPYGGEKTHKQIPPPRIPG